MTTIKQSRRFYVNLIIKVSFVVFIILFTRQSLHAETLIHYDVPELTRYSDLIVIGQLKNKNEVHILEVLKGKTNKKIIPVKALSNFTNSYREDDPFELARKKIQLGDKMLLFLSQRIWQELYQKKYTVLFVANGLFREVTIESKKNVLGYADSSHNGYTLDPSRPFKSFTEIKQQIKTELKKIPARQQKTFAKLKSTKTDEEFNQTLHLLLRITRYGDEVIYKQVSALAKKGEKKNTVRSIISFFEQTKDPEAAPYLQDLYSKYPDQWYESNISLRYLGWLGNPDSLAYFNMMIEKKRVKEPKCALYGIYELYYRLEAEDDKKSCQMIRDSLFEQFDNPKDHTYRDALLSFPQMLSMIPEQGSIDRLQKGYGIFSLQKKNVYYLEKIKEHIQKCQQKMKSQKK